MGGRPKVLSLDRFAEISVPQAELGRARRVTICVRRCGTPQLHAQRRKVAALLTQEPDIDHLSNQEANESTGRYLSYYEHDLVVVDWDAALIMDHPENFDETLYVMELANLQLAELEAYDRMLDEALVRSYRDLGERRARARSEVLRELRDIRIDLARFNDQEVGF